MGFLMESHRNKEAKMLTERETKSANFLRIVRMLRILRDKGQITQKEYNRAKKYYRNLTGADIVVYD